MGVTIFRPEAGEPLLFRLTVMTQGPEGEPLSIDTVPTLALCEGVRFSIDPQGWGPELAHGFVILAQYIGPEPLDLERQRLVRAGWIPPGKHCSCCEHFDWPGE